RGTFFLNKIYFSPLTLVLQLILQLMKEEHSKLSRGAHECVDTIPDLSQMVFAVQALGRCQLC
ncbi:hypothetical protein, partial [Mycobacterium tuberculosis]